jgi:choline dehydrogenase-like flavoprotein
MTIVVAGSGPAGAFAALGALQAGAKVVMIDPGLTPEPPAEQAMHMLGRTHWTSWNDEQRAALAAVKNAATRDLTKKYLFGSDFATRDAGSARMVEKHCRIVRSHALGGLSNVWGRGIEPPYLGECDHWPGKDAFLVSMQKVLDYLPFAAQRDNLEKVMPLYAQHYKPLPITPESQQLLDRWNQHAAALNASGVHFGALRAALRQGSLAQQGCQLCGLCYYGCAYGALFDTRAMVAELTQTFPGFEYRPGLLLTRFSQSGGKVEMALETTDGKASSLAADALIVAAGAAHSTAIVMRSLGVETATLQNSDLITIPMLKLFGRSQRQEAYHTLGQLTMTINRRAISKKAIAIHFFGRNPYIEERALSFLPAWMRPLFSWLWPRLFFGMCFLHSDDSAVIAVRQKNDVTEFTGGRTGSAFIVYLKLLLFLLAHIRKTGLLPLPGLCGVGLPGSSVHVGGSLAKHCDAGGQLIDAPSVFIADAASLPEIPAGSYTLSIMANAHRIGAAAGANAA